MKQESRRGLLWVSALALFGVATTSTTYQPKPATVYVSIETPNTTELGTNLCEVADWQTQNPFNDLAKTMRPWVSSTETSPEWGSGGPLDVDPSGTVSSLAMGQRANSAILLGENAKHMFGTYVLTYKGTGVLWLSGASLDASLPGEIRFTIPQSSTGVFLTIVETKPFDPIRDIQIYREGADKSKLFSPTFLKSLEGYRILRFMDWGKTNNSQLVEFSERPKMSDQTWATDRGVPLEVMASLCNEMMADLWYCIPHTANDAYVIESARLFHNELFTGLRIYTEHSNETWNGIFHQASYVVQRGKALGLDPDEWLSGQYYHADRSMFIWRAYRTVCSRRETRSVLGGFIASTWIADKVLARAHPDYFAIAPYFGNNFVPLSEGSQGVLSNEEIAKRLSTVEVPETLKSVQAIKDLCDKYNTQVIAYEGGQHLVDLKYHTEFQSFNRSSQIAVPLRDLLEGWERITEGSPFVHFTDTGVYSPYGYWGSTEHPGKSSPKSTLLKSFAKKRDVIRSTRFLLPEEGSTLRVLGVK